MCNWQQHVNIRAKKNDEQWKTKVMETKIRQLHRQNRRKWAMRWSSCLAEASGLMYGPLIYQEPMHYQKHWDNMSICLTVRNRTGGCRGRGATLAWATPVACVTWSRCVWGGLWLWLGGGLHSGTQARQSQALSPALRKTASTELQINHSLSWLLPFLVFRSLRICDG